MAKTPQKSAKAKTRAKPEAVVVEPRVSPNLQSPPSRSDKRSTEEKLPGAFSLMRTSFGILAKHWRLFATVALIYAGLSLVLGQGFQAVSGNVGEAKSVLDQLFLGGWGHLVSGLTVFVLLLGSSGADSNPTAGAYQFILALLVSLAVIWLLRQVYAGNAVRARDGFYRGMSPLVQFVLVLMVIALQLIPLVVGLMLYTTVTASGVAVTGVEQAFWALSAFILSLTSLYMVTSSIFALYIVTLQDMTPLRALRTARQLVANRRWVVMRKILFLPLALIIVAAVIVVPFILFATPLATLVFLLFTMLLIPVTHSYLYALYRSML